MAERPTATYENVNLTKEMGFVSCLLDRSWQRHFKDDEKNTGEKGRTGSNKRFL